LGYKQYGHLSEFGTNTPKNDSIRASTTGSKLAKRLLVRKDGEFDPRRLLPNTPGSKTCAGAKQAKIQSGAFIFRLLTFHVFDGRSAQGFTSEK